MMLVCFWTSNLLIIEVTAPGKRLLDTFRTTRVSIDLPSECSPAEGTQTTLLHVTRRKCIVLAFTEHLGKTWTSEICDNAFIELTTRSSGPPTGGTPISG